MGNEMIYNDEKYYLYFSPLIDTMNKVKGVELGWACSTRMGNKKVVYNFRWQNKKLIERITLLKCI
jgi:hypothetical protein